jgi:hypothetical protein
MSGQSFGAVDFRTEVQVGDIDGDLDIDIVLTYQILGVSILNAFRFSGN